MATTKDSTKISTSEKNEFLFKKENYAIIFAGVTILIIGYFLMSGGAQKPNEWKVEEIYSFRRITLAPIVVILGYVVVMVGILKKPKD
jgi:Na+/H+ antiporter NhaC